MIEIIDTNDGRAVRNENNVLALYDLMINTKKIGRRHSEIREPRLHPAQPADRRRLRRAGEVLRPDHTGTHWPASLSIASSPSATMYRHT